MKKEERRSKEERESKEFPEERKDLVHLYYVHSLTPTQPA
jgi:hypothetical protein